MKVLFIGNDKSILTGENGDARERMREYAKHFDELSIIIFSLKSDHLQRVFEKKLRVYPTNSISRWLYVLDSIKIIRSLKIDLISTQDPFVAGLAGVLAKLLWGIKLNIQIHNDFFDNPYFRAENLQNFIFYWLGKFNLLFAGSVRVVNQRMVKDHRYFVAPVATDLDFFWSGPHAKIFDKVVTVARLAKQKNLPLLFEVAKQFPNKKFIVVGEGEERKNLEKIKPANVSLVGQKNRQEIKKIFAGSDLFVLTSNYEGWGLAAVEALAAGLPVVMTATGCAKGLVVSIGDKVALVKAVDKIYKDNDFCKELVITGQKKLLMDNSQQKLVSQFIEGLKKIH